MGQSRHQTVILGIGAILLLSLLSSAAVAFWSPGEFAAGFGAALAFCLPGFLLLYFAWQFGGRGKTLALMMLLAFTLRLGCGLISQNLLPIYGYQDEPRQQSGYLFDDAWRRDDESWRIATKENPTFLEPLTRTYNNDQYGGMAALGIWIYRYLSPDERRFGLIVLLGALVTAAGVPFLRKALAEWEYLQEPAYTKLANIAAWIYVLYPDSVVYAGAPMREPFLTGLLAIVFWALTVMRKRPGRSAAVIAGCFLLSLPFSYFVAGALLCVTALWIWGEILIPRSKKWLITGIAAIFLVIIFTFIFALPSIQDFVHYDIHTTEINSGWVEKVVGEVGGQFRSAFLAVYGITQPVLPAILFYKPTTPFWKVIGIYRSLGWYLMVPFLFYALFSTLRLQRKPQRTVFILNALFLAGWIFVSSLRAGGDQWDNPRYRVIFLPCWHFSAHGGMCYARKMRDWWLVRWVAIELVFIGFFSQWYYSRYSSDAIRRFPFWKTVLYIAAGSAAVFATGFVQPIRKWLGKRKK